MAERPSVREILARVRAAGPARPADDQAQDAPPTESVAPPEETAGSAEVVTAEPTPAPVSAAPPPPTPETLGRPLTLKEKLAAARNRPAGAAPAPTQAPAPAPAAPVEVTPEATAAPATTAAAAAGPPPSAAPHLTPEALGRPLTLKEKLAAARAGTGGAAAASPPSGAKTAPAKPAAAAATAAPKAASTRALPPLQQTTDPRDLAEHLRRAGAERQKLAKADGAAAKTAPAKPAPAKKVESKVVPPKPDRAPGTAAAAAAAPSRREMFKVGFWIAAGWAAFMGGMTALVAMSLRFFFPNVLAERPSTIKVGFPGDFEKGQVSERWKTEWGFWVVRSDAYDGEDKVYALSSICTHLGCPPNWLAGEQKFKCPCHGSGFYVSGVNFEGPAPRPLERYKVTLAEDGQILVDKSEKYQEELGQWMDPQSFIKV